MEPTSSPPPLLVPPPSDDIPSAPAPAAVSAGGKGAMEDDDAFCAVTTIFAACHIAVVMLFPRANAGRAREGLSPPPFGTATETAGDDG
mmetsp:Transcript_29095/g.73062  ORF Transcript_29095/g.73062 Transcript_29095/m.73062 type:complete len:89 (+) Transcript_29095:988-1254(+)